MIAELIARCRLKRVREQAHGADFELRELATEEQIEEMHRDKLAMGFFPATLDDGPFASTVVARQRLEADGCADRITPINALPAQLIGK